MPHTGFQLPTSVYAVNVEHLALHGNPVPCVIAGRRGSVSVISGNERITGDVLFVRPGVEHRVICANGGINAIFLNGLNWSPSMPCAERLRGQLADVAVDAFLPDSSAREDLRDRLAFGSAPLAREVGIVIEAMIEEPMARISQFELARCLRMERTSALRLFKSATGLTFRRYKQWAALQHAARLIASGELARTAAMDAGFADTAHLTRTYRTTFGLTPSQSITARDRAAGS